MNVNRNTKQGKTAALPFTYSNKIQQTNNKNPVKLLDPLKCNRTHRRTLRADKYAQRVTQLRW